MTTLPKIALSSPPALPGGGVFCVNTSQRQAGQTVLQQRPQDRPQERQAR